MTDREREFNAFLTRNGDRERLRPMADFDRDMAGLRPLELMDMGATCGRYGDGDDALFETGDAWYSNAGDGTLVSVPDERVSAWFVDAGIDDAEFEEWCARRGLSYDASGALDTGTDGDSK